MVKKDTTSKNAYLYLKQRLKTHIDMSLRAEYKNSIENSSNRNKEIWSIIRANTKNTNLETNYNLDVNSLNKFFKNVANSVPPSPAGATPGSYLKNIKSPRGSMFLADTTAEEIISVTSNFKDSTALDAYGWNVSLLKKMIHQIAVPVGDLVNVCFSEGVFPGKLKIAKIIPVHKGGTMDNYGNYRPIAILPVFSKIFEAILKNRIMKYLEKEDFMSTHQHGFTGGRSTTTALANVVEYLLEALESGEDAELCCCDLSKAFDCVDRSLLLQKLDHYGLRGRIYNILQSYLTDRWQTVQWNGEKSGLQENKHGVPQGSILGPVLFVLYMNDLPVNINAGNMCLFADDTTIMNKNRDMDELVRMSEESLKDAEHWFGANRLALNLNKTQRLVVSNKSACRDPTRAVKLLGFIIEPNLLSWRSHVAEVCRRLSASIFSIRRIRYIVDEAAALLVYHSGFHSISTYGILIWGGSPEARRVFLKQKGAMRVLAGLPKTESCRGLFRRYGILTIPSCYILACLCFIHDNRREYARQSDFHEHNTRRKDNIRQPKIRTAAVQRCFVSNGINLYNALPLSIRGFHSAKFKYSTRRLLMQGEFYSVREFFDGVADLRSL